MSQPITVKKKIIEELWVHSPMILLRTILFYRFGIRITIS